MGKGGKKREYREVFYPVSGAIVLALILAGFVYKPEPELTVKDYEASIALSMSAGNSENARKDIRVLLEKDPENLYALLMTAYLSIHEDNDIHAALSTYKSTLAHLDRCPELEVDIYDTISLLSMKVGEYKDAKSFSEKRIRLYGENYISKFIIALSCHMLGDDKGYEENLDKALNMGAISPVLKYRLSEMLGDEADLQNIYIQGFKDRAKYEHRCTETH